MKSLKTFISCFLCILLLMETVPVLAKDDEPYAQALNMLGMLVGTENGFELNRRPTRAEALVMLIRLLGKEKEALSASYTHPFTDTGWEEPYVSYAHHNNLINGISEHIFGRSKEVTLNQYCAMLLRALGYTESSGDFTYERVLTFTALALGEQLPESEKFNRGSMAQLSCYALNTRLKNSSLTLGQSLADKGVISQKLLTEAQRCWEQDELYASTTVLIYTIGSDLESQQGRLSSDLKEILRGETGNKCKVILQSGGTRTYHNDYMTDSKAERFSVQGSSLKKTESLIITGAAEPETLTDFIKWGVKEAPAERYILVLWDHGYGIKGGFGADELNQRKTMKVSALCGALEKTDVFFDIIAFDACLMGTAETAFALRNHAKYLIASEDLTPACGLYYTTWLSALESNPAISTRRLGRLILDSFTLHAGIEANIPTTLSMMQLDRASALFTALSKFKGDAQSCADKARLLGENEGIFDQFDILSIFDDIAEVTAAAQALAFELRNSSGNETYSGVAVYIPSRKPEDASDMKAELIQLGLSNAYLNTIYNGNET